MIRSPLLPLAVLGAGLAAVIAYELDAIGTDKQPPPQLPLGARPSGAAPDSPPRASDPIGQWVATSLARPLFNPDRRPTPEASPTEAIAAQRSPAAPPRLAGIMVTSEGRRAIFAAAPGRSVVVEEGGRLGEFTVQSIHAGQVVLTGADGPRMLRPSFDPAEPRRAPPVAAAPLGTGGGAIRAAPLFGGSGAASTPQTVADTAQADENRPFEQTEVPSGLQIFRNMSRALARPDGAAPGPAAPR